MPSFSAIASAVRNPMPHTSCASRYGFARTTLIASLPYLRTIRAALAIDTPWPCRNTITSCTCFCAAIASASCFAALRTDADDLGQPLGVFVDHLERVLAELLDDALRERRPDARG